MNINDKSKELTVAIMNTREFSDLKLAKNNIDKSRELKSRIEDFKNKEKALYSGNLSQDEVHQRADELARIFKGLSAIPEVNKFLKAENDFNSMLQKVYKVIGDAIEFNLKS